MRTGTRTKSYRNRTLCTLLAGLLAMLLGAASPAGAAMKQMTPQGRAEAAADVLMQSYDQDTAWWPSSWWNSAVALTTMMDYMQRTGNTRRLPIVDHTFEVNRGAFPAGERSSDPIDGDFTSRAIDDSEWWGLAWLQAYDLTGQQKYLSEAVTIADYVHGYWDTSTCGGGVWWDRERTYKNSITNGLYVRLTAALHNRIPGDTLWSGRAQTAWTWLAGSGLINNSGLVNDGLTNDCRNNGGTVWTYNQGAAIGGALEVYRATGDRTALATARRLADAALASPDLVQRGVLTEQCDALDRTCDDNAKQFKGVFMRSMMDLADTTGDGTYRAFTVQQANSIWTRDRDSRNRLGQRWAGADPAGHPNAHDWRTQASALGALVAAVPRRAYHAVVAEG
ncbi:glycoside hydrolase family 76 protein [Streptomyces sp. NPDC051320]|uniref:glycoside hydrolase family 76 protein n=1 Tax=Streptomyces sp. NPDC051320 TaxID=3154644 RepID=UPI0034121004